MSQLVSLFYVNGVLKKNITTMQYVMPATIGAAGGGAKKNKTHPIPVLTFLNNYSAASIVLYKANVKIYTFTGVIVENCYYNHDVIKTISLLHLNAFTMQLQNF